MNKEFDAKTYLEDINRLSAEIEAIKKAECLMHYDDKTKLIDAKLESIRLLHMGYVSYMMSPQEIASKEN